MQKNKNHGLPIFTIPPDIYDEMHEYIQARIQAFPRESIKETVSEWAERKRVIGSGLSARPGKMSFKVTPYFREPADNLSDCSPIRETYIIKPTQVGYNATVVQNHIGYCIDYGIGPGLYVGGDQAMAEEEAEKRVDEMIYSSGLEKKIRPNIKKNKGHATGDRTDSKSYAGTFMRFIGPNSENKAASFPMKVLWLDEMDKYPFQLTKNGVNAGDIVEKLIRRQDSYRKNGISKTLGGSTPKDDQISRIEPLVDQGDRRYYNIMCPKCGLQQPLIWANFKFRKNSKGKLDIKREMINGVETITDDACWYECAGTDCDWILKDKDKLEILQEKGRGGTAEWIPTKESDRPFVRSYILNGLYGFREWWDIAEHFIRVKDDPFKFKDFVTDTLGETWKESEYKPDHNALMELSQEFEHWPRGHIVKDVLLLTLACDVQKDRLEATLFGWARNRQAYAIEHFVFEGNTSEVENKCWKQLSEKINATYRREDGKELGVMTAFIDSQYLSDTVDLFCAGFPYTEGSIAGVFPVQSRETQDKIVKEFKSNIKTPVVGLHDQELKRALYNILRKRPQGPGMYPSYYLHFSHEYGEEFYKQLTAEEIVPIKIKGVQRGIKILNTKQRRNEILDTCKMNLGAFQYCMDRYFDILNKNEKMQKRKLTQEDASVFFDAIEEMLYDGQ